MLKIADKIRHKYLYKCRLRHLTSWEHEFIMKTMGQRLMPKQIDKLREIYNKQRNMEGKGEYTYPR